MAKKKIRSGLYEFKGYTFRDCSDDYERQWAVEKDGKTVRGFRTLRECQRWVEKISDQEDVDQSYRWS